jgi:hypothetical protein
MQHDAVTMAEPSLSDDNATLEAYGNRSENHQRDTDLEEDWDVGAHIAKRARIMTADELQTVAGHVPLDTWNALDAWVTAVVARQQRQLAEIWRNPPKVLNVPPPPPHHLAQHHETQEVYAHVLDKLWFEARQVASHFRHYHLGADDDLYGGEEQCPVAVLEARWNDETRDQEMKFATLAHAQFRRVIEMGIPRPRAAAAASSSTDAAASAFPLHCTVCNSQPALETSCWCNPVTCFPVQTRVWGGLDLTDYGDWLLELPRTTSGTLVVLDAELGGPRGFRFFGTTNKQQLDVLCTAVYNSHDGTAPSAYKSRSNPQFTEMFERVPNGSRQYDQRARVTLDGVTYQEAFVFDEEQGVGAYTRQIRRYRRDWVYRYFTCNYGKFARTLQRAFRARQARCRLNRILASTSLSADVASSIIVQDYLS